MGSSSRRYRERAHIIKDILFALSRHGHLNQTALVSYCGLSLSRHRQILNDIVSKGLADRWEEEWGDRRVTKFRLTQRGREFLLRILEAYEIMFPRLGRKTGASSEGRRIDLS